MKTIFLQWRLYLLPLALLPSALYLVYFFTRMEALEAIYPEEKIQYQSAELKGKELKKLILDLDGSSTVKELELTRKKRQENEEIYQIHLQLLERGS
jgi:hypothetical protein